MVRIVNKKGLFLTIVLQLVTMVMILIHDNRVLVGDNEDVDDVHLVPNEGVPEHLGEF